jgi:CheY-like chemotaxis protein
MARKRALVVDDSKSARVILSRMLEKYDIEVDMAESAELAIEYLKTNRPDAIFMDHLMPGMDGLQAVQAIKGNPHTAMIPIMMYTSQEGELYVGQARALGAMGVLPKQVRPVDVSKVLYELHLLPNRRDTEEPALSPVTADGAVSAISPESKPAAAPDIRRFIVASLDSFAAQIVTDVRNSMPPRPARPAWGWPAATLWASVLAAALAVGWLIAHKDLVSVRTELAAVTAVNAELQHDRIDLSAAVKELTAALSAANSNATPGSIPVAAGAGAATTRVEAVPYGEIPFDRSRLDVLRDLLVNLESQGFHGVVKITNLAGIYCLSGNSTDGYVPAAAALPVIRCDLIGNPFAESLSGQQRQSLAFANLIAGVRQRTAGAITVVLESEGTGVRNGTPYPTRNESLTAGEWNRAAAANNRVEFSTEGGDP